MCFTQADESNEPQLGLYESCMQRICLYVLYYCTMRLRLPHVGPWQISVICKCRVKSRLRTLSMCCFQMSSWSLHTTGHGFENSDSGEDNIMQAIVQIIYRCLSESYHTYCAYISKLLPKWHIFQFSDNSAVNAASLVFFVLLDRVFKYLVRFVRY